LLASWIHEDTNPDQDVDASDKWFHHAFDERWRWVATFGENDTSPKEEFLHHAAGLDGEGTGSYIDLVVYRDRDQNSGWTSAADGTMEERIYYCQNWRADVSALVTDTGQMKEWVKYSAYGVPFGLPGGDANSDGDCDASDVTQVDTWSESTTYDVRGDIDLDGDVDATDSSTISDDYSGITMGRGVLSDSGVANQRGDTGTWYSGQGLDCKRNAPLACAVGRWLSRQLHGYLGPENAYSRRASSSAHYVGSRDFGDSLGVSASGPGPGGCALSPPGSSQPGFRKATEDECAEAQKALKPPPGDNVQGITFCHGGELVWCIFKDRIDHYLYRNYPHASMNEIDAYFECAESHERGHATSDWWIEKGKACDKCAADQYCSPYHATRYGDNHSEYLSWAFTIGCAAQHLSGNGTWQSLKDLKDHSCNTVKQIPGYGDDFPELYDCNH